MLRGSEGWIIEVRALLVSINKKLLRLKIPANSVFMSFSNLNALFCMKMFSFEECTSVFLMAESFQLNIPDVRFW